MVLFDFVVADACQMAENSVVIILVMLQLDEFEPDLVESCLFA